jgi:hypothetical protein
MKLNVPVLFLMAYYLKKHSYLLLNRAVPCMPQCIHRMKLGAQFKEYMFAHSKET